MLAEDRTPFDLAEVVYFREGVLKTDDTRPYVIMGFHRGSFISKWVASIVPAGEPHSAHESIPADWLTTKPPYPEYIPNAIYQTKTGRTVMSIEVGFPELRGIA